MAEMSAMDSPRQQPSPSPSSSHSSTQSSKSSSDDVVGEGQKSVFVIYKWHEGLVLYSLYALNDVCGGTSNCHRGGGRGRTRRQPVPILELRRDTYPVGMGFVKLDARLYFIGGQFKIGEFIFTSKKVYYLDLSDTITCKNSIVFRSIIGKMHQREHNPCAKEGEKLDLSSCYTTLSSFSEEEEKRRNCELKLTEGPKMHVGKANPLVIATHGKIYVLGCLLLPDPGHWHPFDLLSNFNLHNYEKESFSLHHNLTELSVEQSRDDIFEVYDPGTGDWTILPSPPSYCSFPIEIIGHAVVRDNIILYSSTHAVYFFDVKTLKWNWYCSSYEVEDVRNFQDALAYAFQKHGVLGGRGLSVDGALYALGMRPTDAVYVYDISQCTNNTLSLPVATIDDLSVSINFREEFTGGLLYAGTDLVYLGGNKFCLISNEENNKSTKSWFSQSKSSKLGVCFRIFKVDKGGTTSRQTCCSADILDSFVVEDFSSLGSFLYCFTLDGKISARLTAAVKSQSERANGGVKYGLNWPLQSMGVDLVKILLLVGVGFVGWTCRPVMKSLPRHQKNKEGKPSVI